jgi:toxin secretion/phage lysis holin
VSPIRQTGTTFNIMIPVAGGAAGWLMGIWTGFAPPIQALLVLQAFDFMSGVAVAVSQGEIDSRIGAKGLVRKGFSFALVLLVGYLQHAQLSTLGIALPAAESLATAMGLMEMISILENYQRAGGNLGPLAPFLAAAKRQQNKEAPSEPAK